MENLDWKRLTKTKRENFQSKTKNKFSWIFRLNLFFDRSIGQSNSENSVHFRRTATVKQTNAVRTLSKIKEIVDRIVIDRETSVDKEQSRSGKDFSVVRDEISMNLIFEQRDERNFKEKLEFFLKKSLSSSKIFGKRFSASDFSRFLMRWQKSE